METSSTQEKTAIKAEIVNQVQMKCGTLKCKMCGELSAEPEGPLRLHKYMKWMGAFMELHQWKGCNKLKIKG